jgi:hypothetical protein
MNDLAINFIEIWGDFIRKHNIVGQMDNEINSIWKNHTKWSRLIVGKPQRASVGSPLGDLIKERLTNREIRYRTEEWSFDLVFAGSNIQAKKDQNNFWPTHYKILIEHENDTQKAWQEMTQLTSMKSELSVLITYVDTAEHVRESQIEKLQKHFTSIIEQSYANFKEDDKANYILIVGQKLKKTNPQLTWKSFIFDIQGNLKHTTKWS